MSYLGFSSRLAEKLVTATENEDKKDIVAYAIEVFTLNVLDVSLALIIGFFSGVFVNTAICLITFTSLRVFTGGAHSKSPLICMAVTALVFPLLALTASFIPGISYCFWMVVLFCTFLYILLKAPVEVIEAPILSSARRRVLHNLALIVDVLIIALSLVLNYLGYFEYLNCLLMAVLWNLFSMSPTGFYFFKIIDQLIIKEVK